MTEMIDNPILNSPHEQPDRCYEIEPPRRIGEIHTGRRSSKSFIPIAITKRGSPAEMSLSTSSSSSTQPENGASELPDQRGNDMTLVAICSLDIVHA